MRRAGWHPCSNGATPHAKARRIAPHPGRRQAGQALALGMLLTGAAALALLAWFGLAQAVGQRARYTHALDAATYSGALAQARALNILAYLNRTQLAHQVAIAHLVTLGAWAHWGARMGGQAIQGNPPVFLIHQMFGPVHGQAYDAARRASGLSKISGSHGDIIQALDAHQHTLDTVYVHARDRVLATLPSVRMAAMRTVLDAHVRHESSPVTVDELVVTQDGWPGYVDVYDGPDHLRSLVADIAREYRFLAPRRAVARNPWVVDPRCPHLRHELRREGESRMDEQGRWRALDTQSFHALRANQWIACYFREYEMGWGWLAPPGQAMQAPHVTAPPDNFAAQDFWRWVQAEAGWDLLAGQGNPMATSRAVVQRMTWAGGGLLETADVVPSRAAEGLRFEARWRRSGAQNQTYVTHSAAEAYYAPPEPRPGGRAEAANLFLPYWQARLTALETVAVRRRRARVRRGGADSGRNQAGARAVRQRGQALSEALMALLWLSAAWFAVNELGRWQDIGLQASHAARHAVFSTARGEPHADQTAWRRHHLDPSAHRWLNRQGQALLADGEPGRGLSLAHQAALPGASQPGGEDGLVTRLRQQWQVADIGLLHGVVRVAPATGLAATGSWLSSLDGGLRRHAYISVGAGHADGDLDAQRRAALSEAAWGRDGRRSAALVDQVSGDLGPVDAAWSRPLPETDWWSRWAGRIPGSATATGAQP